jgi:hypothetical protein
MTNVLELWQMAHEVYARARASDDPVTKAKLIREADHYLKHANEIRLGEMTAAARLKPNTDVPAKLTSQAGTWRPSA